MHLHSLEPILTNGSFYSHKEGRPIKTIAFSDVDWAGDPRNHLLVAIMSFSLDFLFHRATGSKL